MTDTQELAKQGEGYSVRDYGGDEVWLVHVGPYELSNGRIGRATRFVARLNPVCKDWAIEHLSEDLNADFKDIGEIASRFYPDEEDDTDE